MWLIHRKRLVVLLGCLIFTSEIVAMENYVENSVMGMIEECVAWDLCPLIPLILNDDKKGVLDFLSKNKCDNTIDSRFGRNAFFWAVIRFPNDLELLKKMISGGADIHAHDIKEQGGFSPLHHAAEKGYLDVIKLLLEHGAKVNNKSIAAKMTPLESGIYHLSEQDIFKIIKVLVEHGADVTKKTIMDGGLYYDEWVETSKKLPDVVLYLKKARLEAGIKNGAAIEDLKKLTVAINKRDRFFWKIFLDLSHLRSHMAKIPQQLSERFALGTKSFKTPDDGEEKPKFFAPDVKIFFDGYGCVIKKEKKFESVAHNMQQLDTVIVSLIAQLKKQGIKI